MAPNGVACSSASIERHGLGTVNAPVAKPTTSSIDSIILDELQGWAQGCVLWGRGWGQGRGVQRGGKQGWSTGGRGLSTVYLRKAHGGVNGRIATPNSRIGAASGVRTW